MKNKKRGKRLCFYKNLGRAHSRKAIRNPAQARLAPGVQFVQLCSSKAHFFGRGIVGEDCASAQYSYLLMDKHKYITWICVIDISNRYIEFEMV